MSPDDTWLTWVHNSYFKGMSVSCSEYNDDQKFSLNELDNDLQYIDKRGDVAWEITMQLIEPNFNLITQWTLRKGYVFIASKSEFFFLELHCERPWSASE